MPAEKKHQAFEKELIKDLKNLTKAVKQLEKLELVELYKKPFKLMGFALLKGMMIGLGSVLGATVLVGVLIYLLSHIQFVPIVGNFVGDVVEQVTEQIQQTQSSQPEQSNQSNS